MNELILNGKQINLQVLDQLNEAGGPFSPYEQRVLQFSREWLSGQEAFTIHTSGSTGQPKAIKLKRQQMIASAHLTGEALALQPGDKALVCLSVEYIAGLMMLVRGFELGLDLTVIDPVSQPLAAVPPETQFDFTALVPLQLQETLNGPADALFRLDKMKAVLIGGAPISAALMAQLQTVNAPLYHTYGMTETVTHIALKRLNGPQQSEAYVPFSGVELGLDERGCLSICASVTDGQVVQTNDLVQLNPDGSFVWLGRIDNIINSGGVKVQVEKVEEAVAHALLQLADDQLTQRRFFVGSKPDERLGEAVVLVIEGEPFPDDVADALRSSLQASLTRFELPRATHFVPRLLATPSGKIDRLANLARLSLPATNHI